MICPFLAGVVLYLGGWPMLGRLWFPIAFLAFMVPLPDVMIGDINFRLKMLAAEVAVGIVGGLGMPVYLRGAEIFLQGNQSLTVEDACSGLKSLISLLAFATLFTYACRLRGYKRLLLLMSAVPIAVAANVVRIAVLTLAAGTGHIQAASPGGWLHEAMGFVVFIVAFCCMFGLETLLLRLPTRLAPGSAGGTTDVNAGTEAKPPRQSRGLDFATMAALRWRTVQLLAVVAPAIVLTVMLVVSEQRTVRVADFAEKAIPTTLTADDRVWTSTSSTLSEFEMQVLETRDYVNRTYTDGCGGKPVQFCVVFSEDNRKGTHPPDVCMVGTGHRVLSRSERTVGIGGGELTVCELVVMVKDEVGIGGRTWVVEGGDPAGQYMYCAYFYKHGNGFTHSFYRQQAQIIWNGLTRRNAAGALIRYITPMSSVNDLESARARTDQLIKLSFPYIRDNLK